MDNLSRTLSGQAGLRTSGVYGALLARIAAFVDSEFRRYLLASGFAFAVDFGTLFLLTSYLDLHYLQSAAIGFMLGLVSIYLLSVTWVFETRRLSDSRAEFLVFGLVGIGGLGINELSMFFFSGILGIYYLVAKVLSVFLVFGWNYGVRKSTLFS